MALRAWLIKLLRGVPREDVESSAADGAHASASEKSPYGFRANLRPNVIVERHISDVPETSRTDPADENEARGHKARDRADALRRWLAAAVNEPDAGHERRAAVYLIGIGVAEAAAIIKSMERYEFEPLLPWLTRLTMVDNDEFRLAEEAFAREMDRAHSLKMGGYGYAAALLRKAFGQGELENVLDETGNKPGGLSRRPFAFLEKLSPAQWLELLEEELPQITAQVLLHLPASTAKQVLDALGNSAEIIAKIRASRPIVSDVLREVERTLERRASVLMDGSFEDSQERAEALLSELGLEPESRKLRRKIPSLEEPRLMAETPGRGSSARLPHGFREFIRLFHESSGATTVMRIMHETFARLTLQYLSGMTEMKAEARILPIALKPHGEIIDGLDSPGCAAVVNMDPLKGSSVLSVDTPLVFAILDLMTGGNGNQTPPEREITDIELSLMEEFFLHLLMNLRESWSMVLDLRPRLGNLETDPRFMQIVPPRELCYIKTMRVELPPVSGHIRLIHPVTTLAPVRHLFNYEERYRSHGDADGNENLDLDDLPHRMDLALGDDLFMRAEDLRRMRVGDTIALRGAGPNPGIQFRMEGRAIAAGELREGREIHNTKLIPRPGHVSREPDLEE